MGIPKRYNPGTAEPALMTAWQEQRTYHFDRDDDVSPVYSIDTPPPTVSGLLHLGHVFSYTHADIIARFQRMRGANVFYPMGFDDNGLPTERLVERLEHVHARTIGRSAFINRCLRVSEQTEALYRDLWQRLGLSVDWRYTYRTISPEAQREAQSTFIDLYQRGLVYRQEAPAIWCPECETAIAQADLADLERDTTFYTIVFSGKQGDDLKIATTRPELLPACVAIFVHPEDQRYVRWVGQEVQVPHFGQWVPVLEDEAAEPDKGTGAVMCCTFGDVTDVNWWYEHNLPLRPAIDKKGRMLPMTGDLVDLSVLEARKHVVTILQAAQHITESRQIPQSIRVHERCDTPVEYIVTQQWFIRVMEYKSALLNMANAVQWHPPHMEGRMREWIENLRWDWCISRQRYYGVPFPVWFCAQCGQVRLAKDSDLPVDPIEVQPTEPCDCGSAEFKPETEVMDTWATSSLSPQIVGGRLSDPSLYQKVYPFSLRPQAHEIIRTWAFYTLVQSLHRDNVLPWQHAGISGWGLAPEGQGKISKSRGGGPVSPMDMIAHYSADAVRYWASSTGFGKDSVIHLEKIQAGAKLVTKLWNVARFCAPFLPESENPYTANTLSLSAADAWLLAKLQQLICQVTDLLLDYDYAAAKSAVEAFFWHDLADNYIEMAKLRLYDADPEVARDPSYTLDLALLSVIKLLAPFMPFVTDALYRALYSSRCGHASIHIAPWPEPNPAYEQETAMGEELVNVATMVRRFKSDHNLSLGQKLTNLQIITADGALLAYLVTAERDLMSVTRAEEITFSLVTRQDGQDASQVRISVEL